MNSDSGKYSWVVQRNYNAFQPLTWCTRPGLVFWMALPRSMNLPVQVRLPMHGAWQTHSSGPSCVSPLELFESVSVHKPAGIRGCWFVRRWGQAGTQQLKYFASALQLKLGCNFAVALGNIHKTPQVSARLSLWSLRRKGIRRLQTWLRCWFS